jgi:hypothetical protein
MQLAPGDPGRNNLRGISQLVVDKFGEAEGVAFNKRNVYQYQDAPGLPLSFAKAKKWRYECKQKMRSFTPSTLPFNKTRHRRRKLQRFDCHGQICVYFPHESSADGFDFAVEYDHTLHPGCEHFGVPLKIREWIKSNPETTPTAQREKLFRAIESGEIEGVKKDRYLTSPHVNYWWRKGVSRTKYRSKDPWVNAEYILNNNPWVCRIAGG